MPGPRGGLLGAHGDGPREAGQHALDDHHSLVENVLQAAHATRLEQRRHLHCAHPAEHLHKTHAHHMRVHVNLHQSHVSIENARVVGKDKTREVEERRCGTSS